MPPFPTGNSIVELLARQGDAQAQARLASGQIWGQTLAQLGQLPVQIMEQRARDQALKLQQQIQQLQLQRLQYQQQQEQAAQASQARTSQAVSDYFKEENGAQIYDPAKFYAVLSQSGASPDDIKERMSTLDTMNKAMVTFADHRQNAQKEILRNLQAEGVTPDGLNAAFDLGLKNGAFTQKDVQDFQAQAAKGITPEQWVNLRVGQEKPVAGKPGDVFFRPTSGQVAFQIPQTPLQQAQEQKAIADAAVAQQVAAGTVGGLTPEQQATQKRLAQEAAATDAYRRARLAQGGGVAGAPGSTGTLTPEGVEYAATQYRITGKMPTMGMGNSQGRAAIINAAARQTKELGQSPVAAIQRQAVFKADSGALSKMTSMQAAAQSYEEKALQQADLVEQFSQKVPRTNIPLLNKALVAGKASLAGDPNAQQLINSITTFSNEYAKIMEGSTGSAAAVSDSARKAADRLINEGLTKGQMTAVLGLMKREMDLTMQGYDYSIGAINERMGGTQPSAGRAGGAPPAAGPPAGAKVRTYNPATGKFE